MKAVHTYSNLLTRAGFTLVELVIVIVVTAILLTVALRQTGQVVDTARVEQAKLEMDMLARAIAGDATLENNGVRTDFGYVGDVGAVPPNLEALKVNPGSYTTWRGPYVQNRFSQTPNDYKTDPWGTAYSFSGGTVITSNGSGSPINRRVANSEDHLLRNTAGGNVFDLNGTPPGPDYNDSVTVRLTVPDGSGGTVTHSRVPDIGGYFEFDSIPIGNHEIAVVYVPGDDTLRRHLSVTPNSHVFADYYFSENYWNGGALSMVGGIELVPNSDTLDNDCKGFDFWITNTASSPVIISSATLTWTGLTAYYRYIVWDGTIVFNENNPKAGSGDVSPFTLPQTLAPGASIRMEFDGFKENPTGGSNVDTDERTFTVLLSDGSTFDVTTGDCP
jgi:prepilin-type N-terminal cleavage/methylation domain-containing protein